MRYGMSWFVGVAALLGAVAPGTAPAQVDKFYGEPVELRSNFIYFSSWKYVRHGQFRWQVERDPNASEAEKLQGAWLQGDSGKPARFELIDMPRGIRLVAEKAEKAPFQPGQMAAQVFDEGRYKTWYTQGIAADPPEPNSTKDKILPGYNSAICYAESTDGLKWETPKLGLIEYAGNKDNNVGGWTVGSRLRVVFRGDLNGSMRGFHGGCVFVDPSSKDEHYKMFYLGIITDEEWNAFAAKYPGEIDTMARRPDVNGFRCVVGVFGAVSPDGLHWTCLPEPLMIQHADTQNVCYYDEDQKQCVAYVRMWRVDERAPGRGFADADRLVGDSLAMPVTWKGEDALNHGGKPVILRFQLRQASLYGIEFY